MKNDTAHLVSINAAPEWKKKNLNISALWDWLMLSLKFWGLQQKLQLRLSLMKSTQTGSLWAQLASVATGLDLQHCPKLSFPCYKTKYCPDLSEINFRQAGVPQRTAHLEGKGMPGSMGTSHTQGVPLPMEFGSFLHQLTCPKGCSALPSWHPVPLVPQDGERWGEIHFCFSFAPWFYKLAAQM